MRRHLSQLPLSALRAFEAAARHRNLVRAAEELAVTHGAVSHQLRGLEARLGTRLLDRTRRPLQLTQAGSQLLEAVKSAFDQLERTTAAIHEGKIAGEISVSCVPGLAVNWLVPALGDFLASTGNFTVHVFTEHWQHPRAADRYDLAIGYGSAQYPSRRVTVLGHVDFFPVCSAAFIERHGPLDEPQHLLHCTLLHEHTNEAWSRWFAAAGLGQETTERGLFFDGADLSVQAARAGYGIAMGHTRVVAADLAEGRLVRPFSLQVPAAYPYLLITPPESETPPAARALATWILERFQRSNPR